MNKQLTRNLAIFLSGIILATLVFLLIPRSKDSSPKSAPVAVTAIPQPEKVESKPEQEYISKESKKELYTWAKPEEVRPEPHQQIGMVAPANTWTIVPQPASQEIVYEVETISVSGSDTGYGGRAVDGAPINPNWTMGENGLWQNPSVDPPSARPRSYPPSFQ